MSQVRLCVSRFAELAKLIVEGDFNSHLPSRIGRSEKTDLARNLMRKDLRSYFNALSINDETALVRSVGVSRLESAALLLQRGADIEKGYPLVYAAGVGDEKMIQLLLDKGANVNASNSSGHSPLYAAISREASPEAIRLLLQAGADVNQRTKRGETPLTLAEQNGDDATVDLLKRYASKKSAEHYAPRNEAFAQSSDGVN